MDAIKFSEISSVKSVIWIDDEHAGVADLDIDVLVSTLSSYVESDEEDNNSKLKRLLEERLPERKGDIRKFLRSPSDEQHLIALLSEIDDSKRVLEESLEIFNGVPKDLLIEKVDSIFDKIPAYHKFSFSDWKKDGNAILDSLTADGKALILLDLENTREASVGDQPGIEAIDNISKHGNSDNVLIVVFTSTVVPDNEVLQSRHFTNEHYGSQQLPIFMLSKKREVSEAENYLGNVFNRIVLSLSYIRLKNELSSLYSAAVERTFSELRTITAEEMIYKLAIGSEKEGISVIESLLRVIYGVTRSNLQEGISKDASLSYVVQQCLNLDSEIERTEVSDDFIRKFQIDEKYESIAAVNLMYSPVTVGDVFEFEFPEGSQEYLLVGNFCYTSLRGEGSRKDQKATLFPVVSTAPTHENYFELVNYINRDGSQSCYLDFTNPLAIDYACLDLCWVSEEGKVNFPIEPDKLVALQDELPIIRAQRNRLSSIIQEVEQTTPSTDIIRVARVARLAREHALSAVHEYTRKISILPGEVVF